MNNDQLLRTWLLNLLMEENAHLDIETALKGIPLEKIGVVPANMPYSIWQLLEHIRISQWDIVEFSGNPDHISPAWPEGYWPDQKGPENEEEFNNALQSILRDREAMADLIRDPENDLLKPFPHGQGQNLLREVVLIIDHNAYHLGQIIVLRRMLGIWQ